jgi:hypothetical protein
MVFGRAVQRGGQVSGEETVDGKEGRCRRWVRSQGVATMEKESFI